MRKRVFCAGALLAVAFLLVGVSLWRPGARQGRYEMQFFDSFDTVTVITGYAASKGEFEAQAKKLQEKLVHYHKLFDIYHTYDGINNLKTINDAAGREPVEVDGEVLSLLQLGLDMYQKTDGMVNIAYGSVLSIWHECREQGIADPGHAKLPLEGQLQEKAGHTDISNVVIDEDASTVYLADKEMSLDVGSIGKGYAVQRVAEYAQELGIESLLLSVGGNVCAVGGKIDATPWRVGIENPNLGSADSHVGTVGLIGKSIVTSGDYQRYYVVDGERYCHIINPRTGMPSRYFPSVSVLAEDSGFADALSTALFNMEYEKGLSLVESMPGVEALWIMEDGAVSCSSGFAFDEKK